MTRKLAAALALVLACSSTPSPFTVHFAAGQRAQTAGRHAEAAQAYDEAARSPSAPRRDRQYSAYLSAMEFVAAGDLAQGAARLDAITQAGGEMAAQARYDVILLHMRTNEPEVPAELDDLVRRWPNHGVAYPALQARLRIARDKGGEAAVLGYLYALAPAVAKTDSAERVAYDIAESLVAMGRTQEARDAFVDVATKYPYPKGVYFDDSLYRASELDEQLGKPDVAVADLRRMLAELESSTLPGTYIRPRFPDAGWRIATLLRDKLGDKKKAAAAFADYVDMFPNDVRRDDALWQQAKLLRDLGDQDGSCSALSRLVRIAPDSRYVPCATLRCPTLSRPDKSEAPKTCHGYVDRP